jgi:ribosomal protein L20
MPKVRRGSRKKERRTKILKLAKGYWGDEREISGGSGSS